MPYLVIKKGQPPQVFGNRVKLAKGTGISGETLKYRFSNNKERTAHFFEGYEIVLTIVRYEKNEYPYQDNEKPHVWHRVKIK